MCLRRGGSSIRILNFYFERTVGERDKFSVCEHDCYYTFDWGHHTLPLLRDCYRSLVHVRIMSQLKQSQTL